jgi:hypothetical protein
MKRLGNLASDRVVCFGERSQRSADMIFFVAQMVKQKIKNGKSAIEQQPRTEYS